MDRFCTECSEKIGDGFTSQVILQKLNHTGDLCKKCWDIEWKKCISQANESSKNNSIIKEYLDFYKRCYKGEKKNIEEIPKLVEFRKGKAYEMGLVIKDLERILEGDIFFRR